MTQEDITKERQSVEMSSSVSQVDPENGVGFKKNYKVISLIFRILNDLCYFRKHTYPLSSTDWGVIFLLEMTHSCLLSMRINQIISPTLLCLDWKGPMEISTGNGNLLEIWYQKEMTPPDLLYGDVTRSLFSGKCEELLRTFTSDC